MRGENVKHNWGNSIEAADQTKTKKKRESKKAFVVIPGVEMIPLVWCVPENEKEWGGLIMLYLNCLTFEVSHDRDGKNRLTGYEVKRINEPGDSQIRIQITKGKLTRIYETPEGAEVHKIPTTIREY